MENKEKITVDTFDQQSMVIDEIIDVLKKYDMSFSTIRLLLHDAVRKVNAFKVDF